MITLTLDPSGRRRFLELLAREYDVDDGEVEKAATIRLQSTDEEERRRSNRDLRRLLLEAACMAKDWKRVAAEATLLEPFRTGEEPSMFYAAVGYFETGRKDEAKPLMERARPGIAATPFVNYYAERILR